MHNTPKFWLLPGETVIDQHFVGVHRPDKLMPTRKALQILANVSTKESIGENGPLIAARAYQKKDSHIEHHLFETLFGRDSLLCALILLDHHPLLAKNTLLALARYQGVAYDDKSEEEPGRILHEYRSPDDPFVSQISTKTHWKFPYFGSVDSTPLFIILASQYIKAHGSQLLEQSVHHGPYKKTHKFYFHYLNAVEWIKKRLEQSPSGFIESKSTNPEGLPNQVWKDSWDSYSHANGTIANTAGGIASIEVQALAYDALMMAAEIYENHKSIFDKKIRQLDREIVLLRLHAKKLKEITLRKLWTKDERGEFFAIGLDRDENGNERPIKTRASNMGQVLCTTMLDRDTDRDIVGKIAQALFSDEMLCASGIRTLSKYEVRFRPGGYHTGSIWLWDNYVIAQGLRRHGFEEHASYLERVLEHIVDTFKIYPEFVRGDDLPVHTINEWVVNIYSEKDEKINRIEQPPQEIQAWTVAAIAAIQLKQVHSLVV